MNELDRHISRLLEGNECVILPGLGGFVTTRIPARYDEEKGLFLPPYRQLAFQERLTTDDGLLVQSYMESDDLSYPDAVAKVNAMVRSVKADLTANGYHEFEAVGRLSQDALGNYHFTATASLDAGIGSPEFYGLSPVSLSPLTPIEKKRIRIDMPVEKTRQEDTPLPFYPQRGISIHLSTSTLNKVAGIVIMFLLVFLFATPFGTLKPVSSYTGFTMPLTEEKPTPPKVTRKATYKAPIRKDTLKQDSVPPATPSGYCIVLASNVSRSNGKAFIRKLSESGVTASLSEKGKMRRVVYSFFKTKKEAQEELRSLRRSNDYFASAWVMKE